MEWHTHKPRAYSVNDFREWEDREELVLQAKFQRRDVWSPKARSYLIDTILRGRPIPSIYMREQIDPHKKKAIREVVDGQQRLKAILGYLNGDFSILRAHSEEFGGRRYQELPDEAQQQFLGYELGTTLLIGATDQDVLDVFSRLNSYTIVLSDQEKLNAEFYGEFKQTVYALGRDHLQFWRQNRILTNGQIVRMAEAELASELVIAMLSGLQDKKKSIRTYYSRYEDAFPQKRKVEKEFKRTIDLIAEVMGDRLRRTVFRRRALFYSLYCAFYDALYGLPKGRGRIPLTPSQFPKVRQQLQRLSTELGREEPSKGYARLHAAAARQTDNLKPRRIVHRFIWDFIRRGAE